MFFLILSTGWGPIHPGNTTEVRNLFFGEDLQEAFILQFWQRSRLHKWLRVDRVTQTIFGDANVQHVNMLELGKKALQTTMLSVPATLQTAEDAYENLFKLTFDIKTWTLVTFSNELLQIPSKNRNMLQSFLSECKTYKNRFGSSKTYVT